MTSLAVPLLIALTDTGAYPDCVEQAEDLCAASRPGAVAIVVRDRDLCASERLRLARLLRDVTSRHGQLLYVSDRVDLARVVGADGVHLSSVGIAPRDCRRIWQGAISRSGHGLDLVEEGDWTALNAVLISPVFAARKGKPPIGIDGLRTQIQAVRAVAPHVGVYPLGGISSKNAPACLEAGARGVAAIGAAWHLKERKALLSVLEAHAVLP